MAGRLRLKATDPEDLAVIASFLQDAIVPIQEMSFQPAEARFVIAATRFRWEDAGDTHEDGRIYERQLCGLSFDGVRTARVRGIDRTRAGEILSLLTVTANEDATIDLIFAGGGVIRLEIEGILCHLDDFDEPWPTMWRPNHPDAEAPEG